MADNLTQVLGFDASQAIQSINLVNGSLKALTDNLQAAANAAAAFNGSKVDSAFKRAGTAAGNAAGNFQKAGQAAQNFGQQAGQGVNQASGDIDRFSKQLSTIGTVLKTQFILQGFNQIRGAIREGIGDAVDFQKAVAEVSTISSQSFEQLEESIKLDASAFGFDVLDVAEAKYQLFSNQVAGAQENNEAFTASLKLARATASDASDAVGLVSSVLNAYGKEASEAEEVSGTLFGLIEQGRVRSTELASAFGTVLPLASNLGISFEEVAAQLAVITRQGTRASVALTQQRSLFNKLLKPSEALANAFANLGVEDAVEGIQRFGGLVPFLTAINNEAENNITLQAELFDNVRGLAGLLNTFANNGQDVQRVLEDLGISGTASVEKLNEAFRTVNETDAVQLERQLEQLRIKFIELGTEALPFLVSLTSGASEAFSDLSGNLGSFITVVGLAAASIKLYTASTSAMSAGNLVAAGTFSTLALAAGGFAAGIVLGIGLVKRFEQAATEANIEILSEEVAKLKETQEENAKATEEAIKSYRKFGTDASREVRRVAEANREALDSIDDLGRTFASKQVSVFENLLDRRKSLLREFENAAKDSSQNILDAEEDIADLRFKLDQRRFDSSIKQAGDAEKAFAQIQRSRSLLGEADSLIDAGEFEKAEKVLQRVADQAKDAVSSAQASNDIALEGTAESLVDQVIRGRIRLLEEQKQKEIEIGQESADRAAAQRAAVEELAGLTESVTGQINILGDPRSTEKQKAEARKAVTELIADIQGIALSSEDISFADILGLSSQALDIANLGANLQVNFDADAEKLETQINEITDDIVARVPVILELQEAGFLEDLSANPFVSLQGFIDETTAKLVDLEEKQAAVTKASADTDAAATVFQRLLGLNLSGTSAGLKQIADFTQRFADGISDQEIEDFFTLIDDLQSSSNPLERVDVRGFLPTTEAANLKDLRTQLEALQRVKIAEFTALAKLDIPPEQIAKLRTAKEILEGFTTDSQLSFVLGEAVGGTENVNANIETAQGSTDGLTEKINGTKDAVVELGKQLEANKRTIEQTPAPPAPAPAPQNQMFGGFMKRLAKGGSVRFLNSGGFAPRGTDTVPAMLSPGEFVMNARASRKFASQLVAMNAGIRPQFRQEGGTITNSVEVGSIQILGAKDPEATARAVNARLRREFRRGTSPKF